MAIPHALVVPAIGQSHINSCLLLSRALNSVGFTVSFVYFSYTYAQLKKQNSLQDSTHPSIAVHVVDDGRDPDAEQPPRPYEANPGLEENLYRLLVELKESGHGVTCLVSDTFVPWTQDVADRAGLPRVEVCTTTAISYLMATNCEAMFEKGIFPEKGSPQLWKSENPVSVDHIRGLAPFSSNYFPREFRFLDINNPLLQFLFKLRHYSTRSERLLVNSVLELEPEALNALQLAGIHAYPIGPLLYHHVKSENTRQNVAPCLTWLNKYPPKSVLYIAFGRHFKLSKKDTLELAHALEESGCPFLWALRADSFDEVLPQGFIANTSVNGMVIPWAPQIDVLAHPSIGGFLSHCGWYSTEESLWCGVPIIGCPQGSDQLANMHNIANVWEVGFELERTPNGGIEKTRILNCIKKLMEEDVGEYARRKAQQTMELVRKACLPGGQSMKNLEKFYEEMKTLCSRNQ